MKKQEKRKKCKDCIQNCERMPSIQQNSDGTPTLIIDKLAQPALHLVFGAANKLWKYLEKNFLALKI